MRPDGSWVDGIPSEVISPLDRGLMYGDGVFETVTCRDGRPRFLERHLSRLEQGRARLGLPGVSVDTLRVELLHAARDRGRAILKLVVTRGVAQARGYATTGIEPGARILLRYPWPDEPPERWQHGVGVRLGALRFGENPALAGIKHLNRLEQIMARREWSDAETFESLHFARSGCLASGTMSNVFIVCGGELVTPSVESCGVAGVMRELVLETAQRAGIGARVDRIEPERFDAAEELFLTNVRIGIAPVARIGERRLRPGPLTRRLQELLREAR